ncbi:MAG TPA: hypothetical protein VNH13_02290, partial [Candidatus Acidoferrales bacterium]|nr:hypothetical protein [Candidatus Acidoferrales bacterium]
MRLARYFPPLAIAVFALSVGLAVWAAVSAGTLGCDWLAYDSSVRTFLAGGPLYIRPGDPSGPCGYFSYPPPFIFAVLPLTVVPEAVTAWI